MLKELSEKDDAITGYDVTGWTSSANFPTLDADGTFLGGVQDAYLIKFDPALSSAASLLYATYLSGGNTKNGIGKLEVERKKVRRFLFAYGYPD